MPIFRLHVNDGVHFEGMTAFYINAMLRAMVFALVGIFTPIFIYTEVLLAWGDKTWALLAIAGYYLLVRLIDLLLVIPIARLIEKLGFRWSVMVSVVFLGIYLIALHFADYQMWWFIVSAIAVGINIPFYWIARNSAISQDSKSDKMGKQIGILSVLERMVGVLGPVAGGYIIQTWGFATLYSVAFVVLLTSVAPLFSMPHHIHRNGVSLGGFFIWLKNKRFVHQAVATIGRSFDDISGSILWPVVVSLMGVGVTTLGSVFSFLTLISMLIRYLSGLLFDKLYSKGGDEDERVFSVAAIGQALTWLPRMIASNVVQVLWIDGVGAIFGTTYRNISDDYKYLGGKRMSEIAYFSYLEITYSMSVIFFMLIMMVGVLTGVWKELLFGITAIAVLASIVQAKESNLS